MTRPDTVRRNIELNRGVANKSTSRKWCTGTQSSPSLVWRTGETKDCVWRTGAALTTTKKQSRVEDRRDKDLMWSTGEAITRKETKVHATWSTGALVKITSINNLVWSTGEIKDCVWSTGTAMINNKEKPVWRTGEAKEETISCGGPARRKTACGGPAQH